MFPRPDFNYKSSIAPQFVHVSTLLNNPDLTKFNDPETIEKLKQIKDDYELKIIMEPCLKRTDTPDQIVYIPNNNYFSN